MRRCLALNGMSCAAAVFVSFRRGSKRGNGLSGLTGIQYSSNHVLRLNARIALLWQFGHWRGWAFEGPSALAETGGGEEKKGQFEAKRKGGRAHAL